MKNRPAFTLVAGFLVAFALFFLLAAAPLPAQAQPKLVPAQSEISFAVKQMGVPIEGKFKKFDAQLALDPKQPQAGKVTLVIDTASAGFGIADTDAELPRAPWFNASKFPQATFQSTSIKSAGPGKLEVTGKLTVKGNARDVVVPVALAQAGGVTTASGAFTINRLDFKIGEGEWTDTSMVANDVLVKFKLAFSGVGPL
jgi:polyisoprenoid-binding protein YceI